MRYFLGRELNETRLGPAMGLDLESKKLAPRPDSGSGHGAGKITIFS